jgi:hypothetical protein
MVTVALRGSGDENGRDLPGDAAVTRLATMVQSDVAELSTIGAQLDDLVARVQAVGDRYRESPDSAVTNDLDLAERSLVAALRAVARAGRALLDST